MLTNIERHIIRAMVIAWMVIPIALVELFFSVYPITFTNINGFMVTMYSIMFILLFYMAGILWLVLKYDFDSKPKDKYGP